MATGKVNFTPKRHIEKGSTGNLTVGSSIVTKAVSFSEPYPSVSSYIVLLTMQTSFDYVSYGQISCSYGNNATDGFDIKVYNAGSADRVVNISWVAMEK